MLKMASHLDICNTSYGQKKGHESNWQFDSRPLKVRNRHDSLACRQHATYCWKAFNEGYNFASDLITIGGLHKMLCACKVARVPTVAISGFLFGSPETKAIWMWPPWKCAEYIIWGKVVASPESGLWWVLWVQNCSWLVLAPRVLQKVN
jgi:hypothetical protein